MKKKILLSLIILTGLWTACGAQGTRLQTPYVVSVQRSAYIELQQKDRLQTLVDSLNSTLESYRKIVLEKDAFISDQNSIINEKSAQVSILQIANSNADRQILILSKQVRKNNRGKVFWKCLAIGGVASSVALAVSR